DDDALDLGAHRFAGVARLHFLEEPRRDDAVARAIDPTAGPAALAVTQTVTLARTDPRAGAGASAAPRAHPERGGRDRRDVRDGPGKFLDAGRHGLSRNIQLG